MTVGSSTNKDTYVGNGVTTAFATTFPFYAETDIEVVERVIATGAETIKTLTTHYTVAGGGGATGTITAVTAPPSTVQWVIRRKTSKLQGIDLVENDPLPAETLEEGFDRAAMRNIDMQEEVDRALKFKVSDPAASIGEIPASVLRKSKIAGYDEDGKPTVFDPEDASVVESTSTGSTTARTLADRFAEVCNVKDYGAVGDGVADDTAAIQAAIDAADARVGANAGVVNVVFLGGEYIISDTLVWKSCNLVGLSVPNSGVRLIWNGGAVPAIQRAAATVGTNSTALITGFNGRPGTGVPTNWLDLTPGSNFVDSHFRLSECQFYGSSSDCIKVSGWVNLHWHNFRVGGSEGFGIRLTVGTGQNLASCVFDQFTWDNTMAAVPGSPSAGPGLLMIDNSTANVSNVGAVTISNARLEINTPMTGNKAVITVKPPDGSANPRAVGLHLANVTIDMASAATGSDVLLFRETADTTASETLILSNVSLDVDFNAVLGGTWPSSIPVIPKLTRYGFLAFNTTLEGAAQGPTCIFQQITGLAKGASSDLVYRVVQGAETQDRWNVRADGRLQWGGGAGAVETNLYRASANVLKTDDDFQAGDGTWNGGHFRLGAYHLWQDGANNLRFKTSAPASATDGTIFGGSSARPVLVPLTAARQAAALKDALPDSPDGTTLGLGDAAGSVITGTTTNSGATASASETAALLITLPDNYVDGAAVTLRLRAKVSAARQVAQTIDAVVKKIGADGTLGSDICATATQNLTTSYADYDFTVTPTGLVAGDILHVLVTLATDDTGGGTNGFPTLSQASLRPMMTL